MRNFAIEDAAWPSGETSPGRHELGLLMLPNPDDSRKGLIFRDAVEPACAYVELLETATATEMTQALSHAGLEDTPAIVSSTLKKAGAK